MKNYIAKLIGVGALVAGATALPASARVPSSPIEVQVDVPECELHAGRTYRGYRVHELQNIVLSGGLPKDKYDEAYATCFAGTLKGLIGKEYEANIRDSGDSWTIDV